MHLKYIYKNLLILLNIREKCECCGSIDEGHYPGCWVIPMCNWIDIDGYGMRIKDFEYREVKEIGLRTVNKYYFKIVKDTKKGLEV